MEFLEDSPDNNRTALDPNLSKRFLCECRVVERYCWMKGSIILGNDSIRR